MPRLILSLLLVLAVAAAPTMGFPIADNCWPNVVSIGVVAGHSFPLVRQANAGWVRITIPWREVNPDPGVWDFRGIENMVAQAEGNGLEILAILSTAPEWAGGGPLGIRPPEDISLWRQFVRRTATRFAGRIAAYEVWNEPNFLDIGITGVGWDRPLESPPLYTDYLKAAAQEIRSVAPDALVAGPVTSSRPDERTEMLFRQLETEGAAPFMDLVSFHANGFDRRFDEVATDVDRSLALLDTLNPSNAGKPIWITEMGWFGGPSGRENVGGENAQRDLIRRIFERMAGGFGCTWPVGFASEPDNGWSEHAITHAFIFELIDTGEDTSGIYRADGTPKRVVNEYLQTLAFPARQTSGPWHVDVGRNCSGRTCTFMAGTVELADPSADPIYLWDFGDGTQEQSTGAGVSHQFPEPGRYFVRLGVEDAVTQISLGGAIMLVRVGGSAASATGPDLDRGPAQPSTVEPGSEAVQQPSVRGRATVTRPSRPR